MFTGIIEEIGVIQGFTKNSNGATITVRCSRVLEDTKIGDSIAINGCCQTVTKITSESFSADVSNETMNVSTLGDFKAGNRVNLERALTPSARIGGHIVQGHVDCRGKYLGDMTFEIPDTEAKYAVYKGSIAVNGVSLTIAEIKRNIFKIAIIPHTLENTTLKDLKYGEYVNIETDILGRYVEKFLSRQNNNITTDFLKENGFI